MALEPSDVVGDVAREAHDLDRLEPPRMLRHPPGVGAALPSIQSGEEISAVHRDWVGRHEAPPPPPAGRGIVGTARARLAAEAVRATTPALEADLALIGDLIRAVDVLAARVDVIGERLLALEAVVEEVVVTASEDLARVRAALGSDRADGG